MIEKFLDLAWMARTLEKEHPHIANALFLLAIAAGMVFILWGVV